VFADREDAGRRLARRLGHLHGRPVTVLGLPRGGVPVAAEVARALAADLDVVVVRKLGLPSHPELAMGAIAEEDVRVLDERVLRTHRVGAEELAAVEQRERRLLEARTARLRTGGPTLGLLGRVAVVVDDGLATGSTARAACLAARRRGADQVLLAVPVAPTAARHAVHEADEVVVAEALDRFRAVSLQYRDFTATTDDAVVTLLAEARLRRAR
jgi:putative phosphoribosyl transferase